jgi:uncharacterized protein DUF6152/SurA-like protein
MRTMLLIAAGMALLVKASPAHAHHSFAAEYDEKRPIALSGTVTGMQWVNPHSRLSLDVTGRDGKTVNWTIEFGAVEALMRRGWKKTDLAVGSEVTVRGYLARDGSHVAGRNVTLADGSKLLGRGSVTPDVRVEAALYTFSEPHVVLPRLSLIAGQRGRGTATRPASSAILARVNGEPIERWEVDAAVRDFDARSGHRLPGEWRDEVVRSLLEEVIEQHLLAQQAQAKRLDVLEADVQAGMREIRDEYPNPEAFKKAMGDMSPERFRQRTRRTLQASRLLRAEIDPTISVSEMDAKAFYDQNLSRFAEGKRTPPTFADLRQTIIDYLADQRREQKTDAFLKDLKARAKIEIF